MRSIPLKNHSDWTPFPTHVLPPVIRKFVEEGAASIGCDPTTIVLPLLVVIASAIGNTRRLRLTNTWDVPPVLWTAVIGRSGSQKSPGYKFAMRPVEAIRRELIQQHSKALARFTPEDKDGNKVPPPMLERWSVSDVTVESLADLLEANRRGLMANAEELSGWIGNFGRYSKGGSQSGEAARWLTCYDAGNIQVDRKTGDKRSIFVSDAAVCVTGTIQPGTLNRAVGVEHRENGLLPRMLLAYPPQRQKSWRNVDVEPDTVERMTDIVRRLRDLDFQLDRFGKEVPRICRLTDAGIQEWIRFYNAHAVEQHNAESDELAAAFSKLEEVTARLAMVIHLTRFTSGEAVEPDQVDEESVKAAVELTEWFRGETRRVYLLLDQSAEDQQLADLVRWIRGKHSGDVAPRDLVTGRREIKDADQAATILQSMADSGFGYWYAVPTTSSGGAPTRRFRLNG
ncbi:MAG: hypothetical protein ACI8P0_000693 [Planctomycetaceae bacterium]|jgi:hypothetical protein